MNSLEISVKVNSAIKEKGYLNTALVLTEYKHHELFLIELKHKIKPRKTYIDREERNSITV